MCVTVKAPSRRGSWPGRGKRNARDLLDGDCAPDGVAIGLDAARSTLSRTVGLYGQSPDNVRGLRSFRDHFTTRFPD